MPFKKLDAEEAGSGSAWFAGGLAQYSFMIKYLLSFIIVILAFFFVVRPLVKVLMAQASEKNKTSGERLAELMEVTSNPSSTDLVPIQEKDLTEIEMARKLAVEDSKAFAELLRNWLK